MVHKAGKPSDRKPDEWQRDLNPDPQAGQNTGLDAAQSKKAAPTAHDIKDLNRRLQDYTDDELRQIPVLPAGTRLEQGATYSGS
jgi:hypothetical protein